jgi:hypothetical protein
MQIKLKQTGILVCGALLFSACTGQPSIAKIDENEAFKYVKQYEIEYQQIKSNAANIEMPVKWIQAANKTETCKMLVGYNPNDDRTQKDGYKIFWDGKCKNGYAYGLGREMERGFLTNLDAIALYSGEEKEPEYFIQKDNLAHISMEGDVNNGNYVKTTIKDDGMNFDIWYQYGHFANKPADIGLFINSNPFSDQVTYIKAYPNFGYVIGDVSNNEFDQNNYNYNVIDAKNKQANGFGFSVAKNNVIYSGEKQNGQLVRRVYLPQNYLNHMTGVFNEIRNAGQIAIDAQKKALMVKQQYKDTICKDSVKVDFIDNKEYKAICNENEQITTLKEKMDKRLAQIEKEKEVKRGQMNQQRLIQAREAEAVAAQRQADAAETSNFNQSLQNLNNNLQMQQLNNNLMMNNFMPKKI